MKQLIKYSIKEKKITILFVLFIMGLGLYSYYFMPRQENPDIQSPAAQIITIVPGASAEFVEKQVTMKIEEEVKKLNGIESIKSFSQENVSVIIAMQKPNADKDNYRKEWEALRRGLEELMPELPENTRKPQLNTDLTDTAGIILSLSSSEYTNSEIYKFAEEYKEELSKIEGIRKVEIDGNKEKFIEISLKEEKLDEFGLSIEEVKQLIAAQNIVIPVGSIRTDEGKISIKSTDFFKGIDEFKDMLIYANPQYGVTIRLKDIANLKETERRDGSYFIKNGRASILVSAFFEEDKNVVLIGKEVRKVVDRLKEQSPEEILIDEVSFLPEDVEKSVNSFILNLLEGIAFVILVIFLGMGIRNALVVSLVIPLSIASTFVYMYRSGLDLHQVSISALIIALGMLVDNAIVISDATQVNINAGMPNFDAAYCGAKDQAIPILSSTLTTIAAFLPLKSLPGSAGEFVSSLPVIIIVSLSASFFVAMLVTPALSALALKNREHKRNPIRPIQRFYTGLMSLNLKRPLLSCLTILVLLSVSVYVALTKVNIKMFPYIDKDWVYVNISNDVHGDLESTEKMVLQVDEIIKSYPEFAESILAVGGSLPRYYMMAAYIMPAEHHGNILVKFDLSKSSEFKSREDFVYDLQKRLNAELQGGEAIAKLLEINIPGPSIDIKITGEDRNALEKTGAKLHTFLSERKETLNVRKEIPSKKKIYKLVMDDEKAFYLGLNRYQVQSQLSLAINGAVIGTVKDEDGNDLELRIQTEPKNLEELKDTKIKSDLSGQKTPLRNFAELMTEESIDGVHRYNGEKVVSVSANIKPEYGSIQKDIEHFLEKEAADGVEIHYSGDSETMNLYLNGLISASVLALVIIYLILLIQFRSITQPFIILLTLPLAMIGVVLALYFTSTKFTFTVGLGAASLMGIVVNNGILLIEYINRERKDGSGILDACKNSVERRVRPILLSSVTTICGLIPLAMGSSPFFKPMAIALMGGLISATFMTITVIPMIYYLFHYKER